MFATFKVSDKGVGTTKAIVRHRRSTKGCDTCRRRRKKCDETRPVCRRCKQDPFIRCLWDGEQDASSCTRSNRLQSNSTQIDPRQMLVHTIHADDLESLVHIFNRIHRASWVNPSYSLVSVALQYATEKPCLMHAFAACGAAILSKVDSRWEAVCLSHHTRSIRLVSAALSRTGALTTHDHTWLLASINALHIFETLRVHNSPPNTFHLTAVLRLYAKEAKSGKGMTLFNHLVLGEFVFQLAIASTFHSSCFPPEQPFLYVYQLLETLAVSPPEVCGDALNWRVLSPTAVIHNFMDWVFRLSYLRLQVPLNGWHLTEAKAILADLERWCLFPTSSPTAQGDLARPPSEMLFIAELFRCACLILAQKILDPALTSKDLAIGLYVRRGVELLDTFSESNLKDTSLAIWPIFIIGLAGNTTEDRVACKRPLNYLLSTCGIGCAKRILDLLLHAWEEEEVEHVSGSGCLGLDVLFRDDLLSQVIF